MKVLMLNTFDETGGAARAANRLLMGLRGLGIDGRLLVQFKTGTDSYVICNPKPLRRLTRRLKIFLGMLPVRFYPNKPENNFSPALLPDNIPVEVKAVDPDLIHLHWLCAGFLRLETLSKFKKPLVWTLHDSWAFTGGCHVPFECKKYRQRCGACPVLGSSRENDLSRRTWKRKFRAWGDLDLTVVTPSRWLAGCARSSALFSKTRIEVIPNGLDTDVFRPRGKNECRHLLSLPNDKKIILFGAMHGSADPNKGFQLLQAALRKLGILSSELLALIFGPMAEETLPDLGIPAISLGRIDEDRKLAAIYSAADVFVAPSILENLPNTVMEAMACGTPCVAFRQGGVPELVEHGVSGYLAEPYETGDLAQGIAWILEDRDRHAELSQRARQKIEAEFSLAGIADRYLSIYSELVQK